MPAPIHKTKQYILAAGKAIIVGLAFLFIFQRLSETTESERNLFTLKLSENLNFYWGLTLLLLTFLNRYFEILKWQTLVSTFQNISTSIAAKQVLAALTLSIITPNGIGEYGAKALFYEQKKARKIVFLNLVCNGTQLLVTIFFGIIGLWICVSTIDYFTNYLPITIISLLIVALVLFLSRHVKIKGYSITLLIKKIREIPQAIHNKNMTLAVLRYLVFSHQYCLFFILLGVQLPYLQLMAIIAATYFVASALPTMLAFDFAIKGSVAVYFFGLVGVSEWIPAFVATAMWLLNVALPVVFGSYFVIRFKPIWKPSLF